MKFLKQPWTHQLESIRAFEHETKFLLFDEPGTGKTATAINMLRFKSAQTTTSSGERPRLLKTLVLAPLSTIYPWLEEFAKHSSAYTANRVQLLTGASGKRLKDLENPTKDIFVTNHDAVNMSQFWTAILRKPWEFLIVDELHKFKNIKAKRTQGLIMLADKVKYKVGLTGTPITRSWEDLWSEIRIIAPDTFDRNFYAWRARYFQENRRATKYKKWSEYKLRPGAEEVLLNQIAPFSHRRQKKDILDLPPLVKQVHYCELGPLAKSYKQMEELFYTELEGRDVTASAAITALIRLQQICCGIFKTDDGEIRRLQPPKLNLLEELLSDLCPQNKVIVWSSFVPPFEDIALVCLKLGLKTVTIRGDQNAEERDKAIRGFNNDSEVSVCIGNQAAGGLGIGLQAASYMIYYCKSFNLEHDIQSEARAYRGGSEAHNKITRIDLLTKDTVEEKVHHALEHKLTLAQFVNRLKGDEKVNGLLEIGGHT